MARVSWVARSRMPLVWRAIQPTQTKRPALMRGPSVLIDSRLLLALVDLVLEFLADLEADGLVGLDLHGLAGLRVAAVAGAA